LSEVRIVSLPGDGIGPEVTHAMQQVLEAVAAKFGHELVVEEHPVGYTAYEATGTPLPDRRSSSEPSATHAPMDSRATSGPRRRC
jgi:isocitrate/isopropylmalate dehydrogenase